MSKNLPTELPDENRGELLLYQAEGDGPRLEVRLYDESVWLSLNQMADLFQVDKSGISRHLKNIFESGELQREATVANFATVQIEGQRKVSRQVEYFNLDAIISVGYRVNSMRGTQFRIWATRLLKEHLLKGFTLDDKRLKEPESARYFEELVARIRDIRSSEKVFWRKVLDIYATSIDYDPSSELSKEFFKQVQNKMHWAAHGHTAAELIYNRADAEQPQMGVTNFPGTRLLKRDVEVAKNYLNEAELDMLNRIVTAYLEMAEIQAMNHNPQTMRDWSERLSQFLTMTGRELLTHAGTVSHEQALQKAHGEYEKYRAKLLAEPTEVEKHFVEAEQELKKLEAAQKTLPIRAAGVSKKTRGKA
jgi:hypothetical protein